MVNVNILVVAFLCRGLLCGFSSPHNVARMSYNAPKIYKCTKDISLDSRQKDYTNLPLEGRVIFDL